MNISILQWNVWYQEDIKNIARLVCEHMADIICMQELTIDFPGREIRDTPAYLAGQLGYHYYGKEVPIESTDGRALMLANGIFSRFPILDGRSVWTNEPGESGGYGREYRAYVEAGLDVGDGRKLTVGTTHMSYTHRFEDADFKRTETEALVAELRKHDRDFVFTGDLNAVPGSHTIDAISEHLRDAGPDHAQKTWTTKPFSYNGFEETDLNWRLDYVFTTPDIQVASSEIISTDYSDHLPIRAEISLR